MTVKTQIKLDGALNARHLGGYKGTAGITDEKAIIRSDAPTRFSDEDIKKILDYGITTVIDLRGRDECLDDVNPFEKIKEVDYCNIPLLSNDLPPHMIEDATLTDMYTVMIEESHDAIAEVMRAIISSTGGVLLHCTAGKDRTGTISALLLLLAKVPENIIVEEYSYTETLLARWREAIINEAKKQGRGFDPSLLDAKPEFIQIALDYIDDNFENIDAYMRHIGLSDAEIKALREKILA